MSLKPIKDCTTVVEDAKLLYAKDYMALVSPSTTGMGAWSGAWPPGPKPEPYKWTDPKSGVTWTLVALDLAWRYRSSKTGEFISPSNLYDLMNIRKDPETGASLPGQKIPGTPNPEKVPPSFWDNWKIGGLSAGWVILGGLGVYSLVKKYKKRGR